MYPRRSFRGDGHRWARSDLRERWRSGGLVFLVVAWLSGLILCLAMLLGLTTTRELSSLPRNRLVACQPNGMPDVYPERYSYWAGSGFFQITLEFGQLSFTQAKVIDVAWDVICARGGQALMAYVSWHVFTNYVTTSMEVGPITFSTYRTVFLRNESLILAIYRLIRGFTRRRQLHSRIAMVFMVMTMMFILVFPSFASAMTGYSASVKSYVRDNLRAEAMLSFDNNYVAFSSFRRILYVIHDGWRIGEDGDYVVPYHTPYETDFTEPVLWSNGYMDNILWCNVSPRSDLERSRCEDQTNVATYIQQHGFYGLANVSSVFRGISLEPPTLNIGAYYMLYDNLGANWTDPRTGLQPFRDISRNMWTYQNVTYNISAISEQLACQPVKTYQWGFSFIQINIMVILCIIWTIGILSMWAQVYMTMKQRNRTDVVGDYKAVLELAEAINTQLIDTCISGSKEIHALSESALRCCFTKDLNGGSIVYEAPLLDGAQNDLKALLLYEKWWIAAILVFLGGLFSMSAYLPGMSWPFAGVAASLVFTVCFGTTAMSRAVLLFWSLVVLCVLPLTIWVPVMIYTASKNT